MNVEIVSLSGEFSIEPQEGRELVIVSLTAEVSSDAVAVVAAGVDVDGLEVLPSVRIDLQEGTITKELPPLKIFRQIGDQGPVSRDYTLTMAIGTGQELTATKDLHMHF